ncbi:BAH_G0041910.mRNA.1.CDS.1 [Saccharomyces cerevisiae]|nr:SX2_G0024970.mRNA.1.CDS.1 [Saccharomyces cerevisiae]CAI4670427.1 BAH_G0041910.mRNA.1.CDS.1 [Saccharomyces cerevisiae]CAI4673321.1 BAG_1a_G0041960.mRNA.1.CDS.1 [Saccharomyces cerevisiae]CAI7258793.1 BAG_1a_G0041960.mRNA.1.CDS.1 [Saccharomyces cerevisiae]CAI7261005.1 BAH_G0041910.mRNA.1.CDS.1 [Saccharomyces cerevisiae]
MSICPHIQQVFQNEKSKDGVLKTCNAARYILNHSVPKEKFLNTMKCGTCHEINSGATFMCLQCGFCGCWNHSHFLSHSKQIGHIFGINSNNGLLFCFKCEDYIGNIDLINDAILAKYWDDVCTKTMVPSMERRDGLSGLINMGSTCFMSSILQCLIHNPYFIRHSMSQIHSNNCKVRSPDKCFSCALDKIVHELYGALNTKQASSSPTSTNRQTGFIYLLTCAWKINQNLAGYSQQDAHEFWQFIINQIHQSYVLDLPNAKEVSRANNKQCECIVHTVFEGSLESSIVCPGCQNNSKTTIDPFLDLSLDIKDKKKLYECLDSFHKKEQLKDFNYHCGECNSTQDAIKQLGIHKLPSVLVLQLKRFEHLLNGSNRKLDDFIEFPTYLNMKNYCSTKEKDKHSENGKVPDIIYELIGIVSHKGTVNEGHYIAFCKISGGQWFKFNDSMVSSISQAEVLKEQAYLLFYTIRQVN